MIPLGRESAKLLNTSREYVDCIAWAITSIPVDADAANRLEFGGTVSSGTAYSQTLAMKPFSGAKHSCISSSILEV